MERTLFCFGFLRKSLLVFFLFCLVCDVASPKPLGHRPSRRQHHFVLVHGSCHGGWSWYKLVRLLRSSGQEVTALDLAASGVDPRQAGSLKSISNYFEPLMEFMASLNSSQRVVLVGHSLGGLAISQAMERFPRKISVAVFVTAQMPGPSLNVSILNKESLRRAGPVLDSRYTYDNGPNNPPTTFIFGPIHLATSVYQLSPIEDWTLATLLMKPQRLFSDEDMSREIVPSKERYGTVSKVFIQSEGDRLTPNDLVEWVLERNPPDEALKIKGSDHMVMMSKPLELCSHLLNIARKYS